MRRILQWNSGIRSDTEALAVSRVESVLRELVADLDPDFLILQEAAGLESSLRSQNFEVASLVVGGRAPLLTAVRRDAWFFQHPHPQRKSRFGFLANAESPRDGLQLAIWNIHLPSRLRAQDFEIRAEFHRLQNQIREARSQYLAAPGRREIFAGDFNLHPYDEAFFGFNATRRLDVAQRTASKRRADLPPLYNPSWSIYGEQLGPGGTYYKSGTGDGPWFMYDQVLLSSDLATRTTVQLVDRVNGRSFASPVVGKPDKNIGSDHFPVLTVFG